MPCEIKRRPAGNGICKCELVGVRRLLPHQARLKVRHGTVAIILIVHLRTVILRILPVKGLTDHRAVHVGDLVVAELLVGIDHDIARCCHYRTGQYRKKCKRNECDHYFGICHKLFLLK